MNPLLVSSFTATTCIGRGLDRMLSSLHDSASGLVPCRFETIDLQTWIGEVAGVDDTVPESGNAQFNCRNNRLAQLGLAQDDFCAAVEAAAGRLGRDRIGVFIGTSTAGILETELAYRRRDPVTGALPAGFDYAATHSPFSVADFVRRSLNLTGPVATISSACSSSAKVFASARRMMAAGLIDAAVLGGVDSLCLTTLYGFNSLELTSAKPCRPFAAGRDGISIGEGAAFLLVEKVPARLDPDALLLLGVGESSDAYHMSSPRPDGLGARMAMAGALAAGGVEPEAVDYINLHGTATPSNDAAEGNAVAALFGDGTACSSTKGATGHALGAAGGIEAVIALLALRHGFVPAGVNTGALDPSIHIDYAVERRSRPVGCALSNSFGFGGTNCSLLFGRAVRR
ncbi:MAG: beta-ketoacyl-[acyl-carrier-protein] synthase family protein [Betaproteobacteria bacterium]